MIIIEALYKRVLHTFSVLQWPVFSLRSAAWWDSDNPVILVRHRSRDRSRDPRSTVHEHVIRQDIAMDNPFPTRIQAHSCERGHRKNTALLES